MTLRWNEWKHKRCAFCDNVAVGVCADCVRALRRYVDGDRGERAVRAAEATMIDPGRSVVACYERIGLDWPRPWNEGEHVRVLCGRDVAMGFVVRVSDIPGLVSRLLGVHANTLSRAGSGTNSARQRIQDSAIDTFAMT